jgi:hypothetical protein
VFHRVRLQGFKVNHFQSDQMEFSSGINFPSM